MPISLTGTLTRRGTAVVVAGIMVAAATMGGMPRPARAVSQAAATETTAVSDKAGSTTALKSFAIQSSAGVTDSGESISTPGYQPNGWHPAGPRSTVMAALVADHTYPDPFYSTNMKQPADPFTVPWWYRSDFTVNDTSGRNYLNVTGVLSAADIYVNGRKIAAADKVAGIYPLYELDISPYVQPGRNSVAFRIYPNDPGRHLTTGWIDWSPSPADNNMGLSQDITIRRTGGVNLSDTHVNTTLDPSLTSAELTVKTKVGNATDDTVTTTVSGTIGELAFSKDVTLAPRETKPVVFTAADTPQLKFADPKIWWPAGMGDQPLYDLQLAATTNGAVTDEARKSFGIRDIQAPLNAAGKRTYTVNGRPLLIRGAAESPDILLRWNRQEAEDRIAYALNMGINLIRLEGHPEPDEFYDMADKAGMLLMAGWECCNKWQEVDPTDEEAERRLPLDEHERRIAKDSLLAWASELRNHPSVTSFLIGSDEAPTPDTANTYKDALAEVDWQLPVVSDINGSEAAGYVSGMKMSSPYEWVPPVYWYNKRKGGAEGFNAETSAGPSIPTTDTLRRMLSPQELQDLWQHPENTQYHRAPDAGLEQFRNLKVFGEALNGRYGKATGLDDFVRKSQLAQYEAVRAQFEAYGRNFTDESNPSTGVIYWMLNSPWTSLHWQLFDRYFDQGGAYFAAQKANEGLHIQYSYDNRSVVVVNRRTGPAQGLTAHVELYNTDGTKRFDRTTPNLTAPGDGGKTVALTIPVNVPDLSTTYLAKLTLTDPAGNEVSRNVYWLSTKQDELDYGKVKDDFPYTATNAFASLQGLNDMAKTQVSATATSTEADGTTTVSVKLTNTSSGTTPALLTDVHLVDDQNKPLLPVRWTDNQVSLWPGESTTITATIRTDDLNGSTPQLRISGWNTDTTMAQVQNAS
ncbi:exo-beta-D-glucosaminidase [Kitasatospora aureofaciens]|uniref:glycoside hydrolase family 2 protein n=1 Tax=Kitasatospora aureofaciens TaxID=1894 RepID=UPI0033F6AC71